MLQVIRDGIVWFEFPMENELSVREMLMKDNLDRVCEIKPKNINVEVIKEKVEKQEKIVDLTKTKTKKETL